MKQNPASSKARFFVSFDKGPYCRALHHQERKGRARRERLLGIQWCLLREGFMAEDEKCMFGTKGPRAGLEKKEHIAI